MIIRLIRCPWCKKRPKVTREFDLYSVACQNKMCPVRPAMYDEFQGRAGRRLAIERWNQGLETSAEEKACT